MVGDALGRLAVERAQRSAVAGQPVLEALLRPAGGEVAGGDGEPLLARCAGILDHGLDHQDVVGLVALGELHQLGGVARQRLAGVDHRHLVGAAERHDERHDVIAGRSPGPCGAPAIVVFPQLALAVAGQDRDDQHRLGGGLGRLRLAARQHVAHRAGAEVERQLADVADGGRPLLLDLEILHQVGDLGVRQMRQPGSVVLAGDPSEQRIEGHPLAIEQRLVAGRGGALRGHVDIDVADLEDVAGLRPRAGGRQQHRQQEGRARDAEPASPRMDHCKPSRIK